MYSDEDIRRLRWQSRRGMLELDVLLVPFVDEAFRQLSLEDQASFEKLLACEDQDLFVWFMQRELASDPEIARMVKMILDRVQPA
ncbi:succinate dehydrogenase assembly factor 2 [Marinobacterium rhizophilum]|uniref:FAD assembly factor SdhE n=1 Tax=Marinobacterium rhizophilum TaxID=420402 RepID=UPI0004775FC5|nr:succinate dehydrogenase assembly factor 2 [Marinobacterium rhizophilum]